MTVENVACVRGGRAVFGGLSFSATNGDALELCGPNGSGKSSLLRILAGLLPAAAGSVDWRKNHLGIPPIAYSGHRDPIKPWLSVREHLRFWQELAGERSPEVAASAMGVDHLLTVSGDLLSAGQKRRLALARLPLSGMPAWLMDEPTVSLDADGCHLLERMIERHRAQGGLVIVATHTPISMPGARTISLSAGTIPIAAA